MGLCTLADYFMKIVYLHQYFNTPSMPGATRSYEMARRLVAAGHQVHMITSDRNPAPQWQGKWRETDEGGIRVHWLGVPYANVMTYGQRMRSFLLFALRASSKAGSIHGDVIFATSTPLTIALPAVRAAKRCKVPMVFEVRDLWPEVPIALGALRNPIAKKLAYWLEHYAYNNASEIIALSPGMKAGVMQAGYPDSRVTVIPNSCDFELFDVGPKPGQAIRRQYEWLGARPMVIYAGTMGLVNGVGYLVKLAACVRGLNPDIRFVIIGHESRETKQVTRLARDLNVYNENIFILPAIPKCEMPAWLSAANIATSTVIDVKELWANSANKVFDALAAGKPIAINHEGWQADLIRQHHCGIVMDAHDIASAAKALNKALADEIWLARASENAKQLGREKFDRNKLAAQLENILVEAVHNQR